MRICGNETTAKVAEIGDWQLAQKLSQVNSTETSVPENAKQFSGTWPSLFSKL